MNSEDDQGRLEGVLELNMEVDQGSGTFIAGGHPPISARTGQPG